MAESTLLKSVGWTPKQWRDYTKKSAEEFSEAVKKIETVEDISKVTNREAYTIFMDYCNKSAKHLIEIMRKIYPTTIHATFQDVNMHTAIAEFKKQKQRATTKPKRNALLEKTFFFEPKPKKPKTESSPEFSCANCTRLAENIRNLQSRLSTETKASSDLKFQKETLEEQICRLKSEIETVHQRNQFLDNQLNDLQKKNPEISQGKLESTQKDRNKFIGKYANLVRHTKNKENISGETTSSSAIDQSNGKIIVTNVDEKDPRFFKGIEYFGSQSGKKRATTGKTASFVKLNIDKSVTEVSPQQARL